MINALPKKQDSKLSWAQTHELRPEKRLYLGKLTFHATK